MAKTNSKSVNITEQDYVRKTQADVYVSAAKKVLKKHFANAPVDDGQLAVLTVREAFKKGDKKNPLYFGTLDPVKAVVALKDGTTFEYAREIFDNIFIGNKCSVKPGNRAVFTVAKNGDKGYKAKQSSMPATSAKQMDTVIFQQACQQIIEGIDFSEIDFADDVKICDNTVTRSQVFTNGSRRNLHIDFESAIAFDEKDLLAALGLTDATAFISKKSAVVMWEV